MKKNTVILLLNLAIIAIFVLLCNITVTGMLFHRIAGIVIMGAVLIQAGIFLIGGKLQDNRMLKLGLNIVIALGSVIVLVSGILLSVPGIGNEIIYNMHKFISYILGVALVVQLLIKVFVGRKS